MSALKEGEAVLVIGSYRGIDEEREHVIEVSRNRDYGWTNGVYVNDTEDLVSLSKVVDTLKMARLYVADRVWDHDHPDMKSIDELLKQLEK